MSTERAMTELGRRTDSVRDVSGLPRRKVLVLAYRFPPQGGGGVQRTLKFVKYLPQQGWLPIVQTVSNPYWPLQDATLLAEIPSFVKVHGTRTFEFERLGRTTEGLLTPRGDALPREPEKAVGSQPRRKRLRGMLKAAAALVQTHVLVPDPQITWVPGAFLKGLSLIRKERPAVMYSSSPPNSPIATPVGRTSGMGSTAR